MKKPRRPIHRSAPPPSRHRPIEPHRLPELLAPAGSPATWAAAVEAGADAVYLGLKDFSARAFAANFTLDDLARLVPLSHDRGVKVFVAFNSLLKEEELTPALRLLDGLSRIGPDALIMQDLGLFRLVKRHYPQFEVHASTLTATHNLAGLRVLAGLGYDRAVLARELTFSEIEDLAARSPIGLEVFIHGALCFSFSGLCLMSSFLGGKGSLRGACTQPCRRRYATGKKSGYFFSPTDLDASTLMLRIRNLPLAALKIEGRMKGAQYVSHVVRAYRMLLDAPADRMEEALAEAASLIEVSLGRQRSTGFFQSPHPASGLAPSQAATSGLFIGRVLAGSDDGALIRLQHPLETGDRLRVQFKKDDEREAYNLRRMAVAGQPVEAAEAEREVFLYAPFATNEGDLVFKVDSGRGEEEAMASPLVRAFKERAETQIKPSPALKSARADLVRKPGSRAGTAAKPEVWYRLPRAEMLTGLAPLRPDAVILPLTRSNVRRAAAMRRRLGALYDHLVWSLPPLIFESDKTGLRADLAQLGKMKVFRYMISNLGHLPLLPSTGSGRGGRGVTVYADHRLNCLNSQTEAALAGLGIDGVTLSVETDEDNMKRLLESTGPVARLIYLYGRPPLFTSRFVTAGLKDNLPVESPRGEKFRWRQEGRTAVLFSERPVFMAPLLKYKPLNGVKAWIVDLEYDPRPVATAFEVNEAIAKGRPIRHASRFNFGRSLY